MVASIKGNHLEAHGDQISAGTIKANDDFLLLLLVIIAIEDLMLKIEIKTGLI